GPIGVIGSGFHVNLEGTQDPVAVFAVVLAAGDEELFLRQVMSAEFHVVADHVLGEADLRGNYGAERFGFSLGQGRFLGRGGFVGTLMGAVELPGAESDAQRSTGQQQHQDPEQPQAGSGPEPVADSATFLHPSRVRGPATALEHAYRARTRLQPGSKPISVFHRAEGVTGASWTSHPGPHRAVRR